MRMSRSARCMVCAVVALVLSSTSAWAQATADKRTDLDIGMRRAVLPAFGNDPEMRCEPLGLARLIAFSGGGATMETCRISLDIQPRGGKAIRSSSHRAGSTTPSGWTSTAIRSATKPFLKNAGTVPARTDFACR